MHTKESDSRYDLQGGVLLRGGMHTQEFLTNSNILAKSKLNLSNARMGSYHEKKR